LEPTKDKKLFKHKYDLIVKFNEVDMLHIVNNAVYFNYLEQARIKYAKDLGILPNEGMIFNGTAFYMAHNEINYLKVAQFEEELRVYTRVSYIKHRSFQFEHIIENIKTNIIIAEGSGILVHVDPITKKSLPLPKGFVETVINFEKEVSIVQ
jgi:acyl-CoA thioester hydrolase